MKSLEDQLEQAIQLASTKHYGQRDKSGKPYIFHLLHVMNNVNNLSSKIVAILHDILEDTDMTKNDLLNLGFCENIVEAIDVLTKTKQEVYMDYIKKVNQNPIAKEVKLADLKHNMDLTRLETISEKDLKRVEKYVKSYKYLTSNSKR